jgi:hypothetical protein
VTQASAEPELIDLGEIGWRGTLDGGEGRRRRFGSGWRGRTLPPRAWRALSVLVILATVLPSAVGSSRPDLRLGRPLWTARVDRAFGLGAATAYVENLDGLAAYSSETGRLRWRMPGQRLGYLTETVGGLVLVAVNAADERATETVVVDTATGRVLTRHRGFGIGAADEHHVVLVQVDQDDCTPDPSAPVGCQTLVGVNVANGREQWHLAVPGDRWITEVDPATGRIRRLLVMGSSGTGTVYDPVSGSPEATLTLDLDLFPDTDGRPPAAVYLTAAGVITSSEAVGGLRVSLWSVGTPGLIWTTHIAGLPLAADSYYFVGPIGDVIQVVYSGRTTVLDPATGQRRFSLSASNLTAVGGGRLLVEWFSPERRPMLVDPVTGVTVATFLEAAVIRFDEPGERVLLARFGSERALFELADLRGRPLMVDEIDAVGFSCRARRDLLACVDDSGVLRVWRLPER